MPEKNYWIILDDENFIFIHYATFQGKVIEFVIKYIAVIEGEEKEILRYDSGHEIPHLDILGYAGEVRQKVWLPHLTFAQALTQARQDIEENYMLYRERFLRWKR